MIQVAPIASVSLGSAGSTVEELCALSLRALKRMYLPDQGLFAFRLRRVAGDVVSEGISPRYTAMTLLGLMAAGESAARDVLAGNDPRGVISRLLERVGEEPNLGNVALTLWAARSLGHEGADLALIRLKAMDPLGGSHPTVELAWALTALSVSPHGVATDADLAARVARRLLQSQGRSSHLFPHWPAGCAAPWARAHVLCFADLVYPIHALSHYHGWTGDSPAMLAASSCAARMVALQGDAGQWWWHFDSRTGRVVERFPVYSVHQDAMAPMALFALADAGGEDYSTAIKLGMEWLKHAVEIDGTLVDREADLIWRKVHRREPGKVSRMLQAGASRLHPSLRFPVDPLFPPDAVDYECRPYHLGWLLYAWAGRDPIV